jgi:hypothetical protein
LYFGIARYTYDSVAKELGVVNKKVPCNSTKNITLTMNGFDLEVMPGEYLDRSDTDGDYCKFIPYKSGKLLFDFGSLN